MAAKPYAAQISQQDMAFHEPPVLICLPQKHESARATLASIRSLSGLKIGFFILNSTIAAQHQGGRARELPITGRTSLQSSRKPISCDWVEKGEWWGALFRERDQFRYLTSDELFSNFDLPISRSWEPELQEIQRNERITNKSSHCEINTLKF